MFDILKKIRARLNPPEPVVIKEEVVNAHLCEGKEWKDFQATLCPVCRGDSMNFRFPNRKRYDDAVELKDKQLDRKAS